MIPWGRHWIIGTTDTAVGPRPRPPGRVARRHRLPARAREHAARGCRSTTTTSRASTPACGRWPRGECRADLAGSPASTPWSRPVPGLVMIAGGKLTTYRVMARDAVDAAAHSLGRPVAAPSITDAGAAARRRRLRDPHQPAGRAGPALRARTSARIDHLLGRYGGLVDEVLALIAARPDAGGAAAGHRGLPARRGRLRRHPRGRPAPRRRADPAYPDLDRDLRPRHRRGPPGRRADGRRARLGRGPPRRRGRPLPAPGRGRAAEPARSSPTRRPTRPGCGRRRVRGRCECAEGRHEHASPPAPDYCPVRPSMHSRSRSAWPTVAGVLLDHVDQQVAERHLAAVERRPWCRRRRRRP